MRKASYGLRAFVHDTEHRFNQDDPSTGVPHVQPIIGSDGQPTKKWRAYPLFNVSQWKAGLIYSAKQVHATADKVRVRYRYGLNKFAKELSKERFVIPTELRYLFEQPEDEGQTAV
jgi:hypothetical protein